VARPLGTVQVRFDRLPELAARMPRATSGVLTRGAYATEAGMKQRVPVRTGNLRNSIQTEGATPGSQRIEVWAHAEYAAYVEYGTRRMPPRPYTGETVEITFRDTIRELRELERLL
jgi:HK97 gp10 family phage protein